MRVLFVSGIDGFCHRYEVLHRAEQHLAGGGQSRVRSFLDPRLGADLEWAEALFVYRTPITHEIAGLLTRARAAGITILGSIDDLIFVSEPEALPSMAHLSARARHQWREGVRRYRATLEQCDLFVAPSEPLRNEAARLGLATALHPDAASEIELALGDAARRQRLAYTPADPSSVTLGYFSGSPTHDRDFAEAAPAILSTLQRHTTARLLVLGPLTLPTGFDPMASRIERVATVPWSRLPSWIATVDVNLAPLCWRERFSAAKGEVKYIEAAAAHVATVASPTPAFREAITHDHNGKLAANPAQWREALDELVRRPDLRRGLGRAARLDVEERYSTPARVASWQAILARAAEARHARPTARPAPIARSLPGGHVALEPAACPDLLRRPGELVTPPVVDGQILTQTFTTASDALHAVDLHAVTYGQSLSHDLRIDLRDEHGEVVASVEGTGGDLADRSWFRVAVPRTPRGRTFRLDIATRHTGPGNAPSFSLATVPGDAQSPASSARLDSTALAGPLALRTFVKWSGEQVRAQGDRAPGRAAAHAPDDHPPVARAATDTTDPASGE